MSDRWQRNKRHWEETLDAQNLGKGTPVHLMRRQAELYNTADIRFAFRAMEPLQGTTVLDVGGGLALAAILLARKGARVVIADLSLPRLKAARKTLQELGLIDRVDLVVARGEEMPFRDRAFTRIMSKAVLIHTDLARAMAELHRILATDGRMLILEPTTGNPFVNLYRKLLAPKVWEHITSYFGAPEMETVRRTLPPGRSLRSHPFFLFGFFASVFEFTIPSPALYRSAETVLCGIDTVLFGVVRPLRNAAWFNVIVIEPERRRS
jgi:SAM-dependent methyltransferase